MQTQKYKQYIKSDMWKEKCKQRLEIAGYQCEMCGRLQTQSKALQIHHITYKNLGNEDVNNDLVALCGRCHILIHRYYDRKRA